MQTENFKIELDKNVNEINNLGFSKQLTLNETQVADILGVKPGTVSNWRKDGKGPKYIKQGKPGTRNRVLYPKIEIAKFLVQDLVMTA